MPATTRSTTKGTKRDVTIAIEILKSGKRAGVVMTADVNRVIRILEDIDARTGCRDPRVRKSASAKKSPKKSAKKATRR